MVKTKNRMQFGVLLFSIALLVALVAPSAAQAQTGTESGQNTLTVLTVDNGDAGTAFIVLWVDSEECNSQYAIYIGGVDTSTTSLPEGAAVSDTERILAGTAESTDALLSVKFPIFRASGSVNALSVSVFCGDHSIGRLVAEVNDIPLDIDSGRPVEGAYSGELTLDLRLSGSLNNFDASESGLQVTRRDRQAQDSADEGVFYHTLAPVGLSSDSETHSSISTTIADSGTTGSTFTITWVDADDCTGNYNLYMDNIDANGVGLPSGATQDSTSGRVDLGSVAATTDPLQKVAIFTTVKAESGGDHISLLVYCGDDETGSKVDSDELPVDSTSLRPVAGTYSSAPGITAFQINGTAQSDFDPYDTHEEYYYTWNVGEADEATIKPVLKDGYSATYYGSTKVVYSVTVGVVDFGKFATWTINYDLPVTDADDMEDDFQLEFDDNDPNGTDWFRLSVSRGDYHTGHQYDFFIIRKAAVAGSATVNYAENGTDTIGTYTISDPDRDYTWQLASRTGEGEEDDKDAFIITKNDDENGVVSFASSPDYEAPTDSSSPPDNVYHTSVLGWEVNPVLSLWYGNYYGSKDVQVTVTDVDPE